MKKNLLALLLLHISCFGAEKPNVVYILADDLGYGDVHCLNPERGKIPTPEFDKIASQGMTFTDAHSSSSVCTPARYGIITGRYNWRTRLQSGVLLGHSTPLIPPDRLTVPALLKKHGYTTACVGKWHLGMNIPKDRPNPEITEGPTTRGFDSYFGISASLDMPPFAFIENDHFVDPLTTTKKWLRTGPASEDFEAMDVLPSLTRHAAAFIKDSAASDQPFFLYMPLTAPHTPIVPTKEWRGKSGLGDYGDFVMQTDWSVGQIMKALDETGVTDNTLVIVTSDNGCSKAADIPALEAQGHYPCGNLRGSKADIFDGGHRVPFFVRWPGTVKANSRCEDTVCLTDLIATCADILGDKLPPNAGEDSVSLMNSLRGEKPPALRKAIVHHSINGSFALRQGPWKLELCPDSGGWSTPKPGGKLARNLPDTQLYDIGEDLTETNNLQADKPETVRSMTALLQQIVDNGRGTPGPNQPNDAPIKLRKTK